MLCTEWSLDQQMMPPLPLPKNIGGSVEGFSNLMNQARSSDEKLKFAIHSWLVWWKSITQQPTWYGPLATSCIWKRGIEKILMATKHTVSKPIWMRVMIFILPIKCFPYRSLLWIFSVESRISGRSLGNLVSLQRKDNVTLIAAMSPTNSVSGTYDDTKKLFDSAFASTRRLMWQGRQKQHF